MDEGCLSAGAAVEWQLKQNNTGTCAESVLYEPDILLQMKQDPAGCKGPFATTGPLHPHGCLLASCGQVEVYACLQVHHGL